MRRFDKFNKYELKKAFCVCLAGTMMLGAMSCGKADEDNNPSSSIIKDEKIENASSTDSGEKFDENSKDVKAKTKEIERYIDKYFYFDEDNDKREESYYDGLMKGLDDPYSVYYTADEYQQLKESDAGSFEGIGATVAKNPDSGVIYVVKPLSDSPAEKAGLLPGDIILKVDDLELTTDMELDYVVRHIRGEKGTDVNITVYREDEPEDLTFTITRDKIETKTVEYEMLDDNIGYIYVEEFIENTPKFFKEAVDDLQSQGAKGIVIDMRSNPGGLVNAVTEMLDYLLDDELIAEGSDEAGLLIKTKDKNDEVMDEYGCSDGHSVDLPMAVIVNGNSASAAEIFAGCLQDYKKAKIVGTTTYGKGIVQTVVPLSDGSAIKITIAQYFIPSGKTVHKVGVEPDVEVELDESLLKKTDIEHDEDNQLQEAIKALDLD
ncbi:MAG: S41 family peptidase [Eubacterium sp.]|nr:S41 family peptidase [Eubacterium sp.]